jgi:hypothetical protein
LILNRRFSVHRLSPDQIGVPEAGVHRHRLRHLHHADALERVPERHLGGEAGRRTAEGGMVQTATIRTQAREEFVREREERK